jgi:hypothetical protein
MGLLGEGALLCELMGRVVGLIYSYESTVQQGFFVMSSMTGNPFTAHYKYTERRILEPKSQRGEGNVAFPSTQLCFLQLACVYPPVLLAAAAV